MWDVRVAAVAAKQFNRISKAQLREVGLSEDAIFHRVRTGRLFPVHDGVFSLGPVRPDDDWGRWMAATLTAAGTVLSHASAAAAWGIWSRRLPFEVVTRPGAGGPRRIGALLVHRSATITEDLTSLRGIPISQPARTLLDLAGSVDEAALARLLREAVRLKRTTLHRLGEALGRFRGRRSVTRLAQAVARYSGLPLERARSGAEIRALEILRDAGYEMPRLNYGVAGEEADLSWQRGRLIVEIDGGPFHLDRGEDARKQAVWESAGWTVRRISSDDIYEQPNRLLRLLKGSNVRNSGL